MQKFDSLTGLRSLLALMVLVCHGWLRCGILPDHKISAVVGEMGHSGVSGFFILSGFILAHVYRGRRWSTREFAVNRIARIYPLYLLALLFALPIDWYSPMMSSEGKLPALGLSTILCQSWFPFANGRFNPPGWTLSVEALFYTFFPCLFLLWKLNIRIFVLLCMITTAITAILWLPDDFFLSHRFPAMRAWEFMLGMVLAALPLEKVPNPPEFVSIFLVLATPLTAVLLHMFTPGFAKWLSMAILSAMAILFLAARDHSEHKKTSLLSLSWMVILGEISYGIYLLHDTVQRYARFIWEKSSHIPLAASPPSVKILFLIGTTLIALMMAYISWSRIETPARLFIRKKFHSRT